MNIRSRLRDFITPKKMITPHVSVDRTPRTFLDVFIHIPKTGGSCVRTVIGQNYKKGEIRGFSGFVDDFDKFMAGDGSFTKSTRLLHGHVPYGIADNLGVENVRHITMVREPAARLVSDYMFALTPASGYFEDVKDTELNFITFINQEKLRNAQSKWIAGIHPLSEEVIDDDDLLQRAIMSLDKYLVVGVNEYLPETMLLFAQALGWNPPVFKSVNVSPLSKRFNTIISSDERRKIRSLNEVDYIIYEKVLTLFRSHLLSMGPSFWNAVKEISLASDEIDNGRTMESMQKTFVLGTDNFEIDATLKLPFTTAFINQKANVKK